MWKGSKYLKEIHVRFRLVQVDSHRYFEKEIGSLWTNYKWSNYYILVTFRERCFEQLIHWTTDTRMEPKAISLSVKSPKRPFTLIDFDVSIWVFLLKKFSWIHWIRQVVISDFIHPSSHLVCTANVLSNLTNSSTLKRETSVVSNVAENGQTTTDLKLGSIRHRIVWTDH